jgi:xylan 1,4-beta-xylosidase
MTNGTYTLNVYRTGYKQNDAYTAYLAMGSPNQLTREQVAALQKSASGAPSETRTVTIRNHVFEQQFEMHQNDAVLVTLQPK